MSTTGSGSDQPARFAVSGADSQESYERIVFALIMDSADFGEVSIKMICG